MAEVKTVKADVVNTDVLEFLKNIRKGALLFETAQELETLVGAIPFWLLAPYFQFVPAIDNWTDDALPNDRHEIDREFAVVPQVMPAEEETEEAD